MRIFKVIIMTWVVIGLCLVFLLVLQLVNWILINYFPYYLANSKLCLLMKTMRISCIATDIATATLLLVVNTWLSSPITVDIVESEKPVVQRRTSNAVSIKTPYELMLLNQKIQELYLSYTNKIPFQLN